MIFFKHIYRSIKKSPLQPLIILLTLTLSVASLLTAVKICINVSKENEKYKTESNVCDINIKPSSKNDVRFMFVEDAEEIIGDAGTVLGEFNFTALVTQFEKDEIIEVSAADIIKSDEFYGFKYLEYGEFTEQNVNNSLILSSDFAVGHDIKVGDTLTLFLLNERMNFTVQAIGLGEGYLDDIHAVINIGSITKKIAEVNPAISSFMGTAIPYTHLKIRINDPLRVDEFVEKLATDERFSERIIIKESDNVGSADFMQMVSMLVMFICASIIIILSAIVISTSLELLNRKRLKESALFMLSGASTKQLNAILYLECFVYGIISAFAGLLLSLPICKKVNTIFTWNTDDITFRLYDIPIALLASPIIVLITAFIHSKRAKKLSVSERISDNSENKAAKSPYFASLITLAFSVIFLVLTLSVKTVYKYIFALWLLVGILVFIYLFVPFFMDTVSRFLIKTFEKRKKIPPKTILVLKNASVSYPLKHTTRLITLLIILISTIFVCIFSLTSELKELETLVDCDYVSIDGNEKTAEMLENLDEVDDTFRFTIIHNITTEQNTGILAFSASDDAVEYLNPNVAPKKLPRGNEIVISSGIAMLGNTKVGDSISLFYEANEHTYTVTEIIKSSANIVFFDAESVGSINNFLCIKTDVKKDSAEYQKIANILETRGIMTIELDVIFEPVTERLLSYSKLLIFVTIIAIFTTLCGIINVIIAANVARRREREVYYTVGMSKKDIRKTQIYEILYVLFIALLLIPFFTLFMALTLDVGLASFGVDLLYF